MDNRVYYGEYSLKHWIDLILKENIILPEYQRHFVWSEEKVKTLVRTLKSKQFVPPVTIGAFKNGEINQNLILDGQQRLTSLLLAYLGLYPNEKTYKEIIIKFADENDDDEENADEPVLKWTFKALIQEGKNKQDILSKITDIGYKKIEFDVTEDFLKSTSLGFSYLVPEISNDDKVQLKYYSSVFRNINIHGQTLLPQESRASLYFLDETLVQFFDPQFLKNLSIKSFSGGETQVDFVRYLSLLSQYKKDGNSGRVARGYKPQMEKYYEEYIYSVVGENASPMFADFPITFPDKEFKTRFERLKQTINLLEIPKQFPSIIDLDLYLFGLTYTIAFEDKSLDTSKKEDLKKELEDEIKVFKEDLRHAKAPSALKYLKSRIDASIEIYKKYANE